jgi:hypothetical protein
MVTFKSSDATKLLLLSLAAFLLGVTSLGQTMLAQGDSLQSSITMLSFMGIIYVVMAYGCGLVNTGIAAVWAQLRGKDADLPASFNFGVQIFVVLQVLGFFAYAYLENRHVCCRQ